MATWDTTLTVLTEPTPGSEPEFDAVIELAISVRPAEDTIVTLAECQYDARVVPTLISFEDGRQNTIRYRYVPELGLPISAELVSDRSGESDVQRTFFSFDTIEALGAW